MFSTSTCLALGNLTGKSFSHSAPLLIEFVLIIESGAPAANVEVSTSPDSAQMTE